MGRASAIILFSTGRWCKQRPLSLCSLQCTCYEEFVFLVRSAQIQMFTNSPGGLVSAGLAIYDTMRFTSRKRQSIFHPSARASNMGGCSSESDLQIYFIARAHYMFGPGLLNGRSVAGIRRSGSREFYFPVDGDGDGDGVGVVVAIDAPLQLLP